MIKKYFLNKKANLKNEYLVLICAMVLIFLIHIRNIGNIAIFSVLDDEFGYWGSAAYLAGLDWSNTVSQIPYYSYGYSLLLVPLFWIFDNPIYMYKAAIVINGILLSASFLLCYDIARKLMNSVNKYTLIAISLLISMYPTYVVYSNIAWSECLLIFVCWLLTWCFVGLDNQSRVYKFILIGILNGYVYIIHQRSLGILIASITVILLMKILNKINLKHLLSITLPFTILMIIHFYLKNYIQSNLWLNNAGNLANDYAGQAGKLSLIFTIEGLSTAFKVLIGQTFYLASASYLISFFGLYELIKETGKTIAFSIKSKSIKIINQNENFYLYIFLLIALFLSLSISVIFVINPTRIDHIVYGRYTEMIIGPILLLGFVKFAKKETIPNKTFILVIIGYCFFTIITNLIITKSGFDNFNLRSSVGLGLALTSLNIYLPAFIAILGCRLLVLSFAGNNKRIFISLFLIVSLFFITGNISSRVTVSLNQETMGIMKVVDLIRENEEDYPVYFLWNDDNSPVYEKWDNRRALDRLIADSYQFLLKNKKIILVSNSQLSTIPGNKFVITTESIVKTGLLGEYKFCTSAAGSYLYISK